ncbi:formate dehydrogenase subunit gamma [Arenibaculum pallidiluteum]|uniref:formate dehydrogenase subunit gamma n=1 Tax=Arenibaculum pallidiluteum TaxID=2812559 RepID=UPI001A96D51E|nr:formate dehydrogenase subunit gamma [Arenibaculum pallidiluteum]
MTWLKKVLLPALLGLVLHAGAHGAQAQLYQVPGQAPAASKDEVQIYMDRESELRGIVSIPDRKLSVLVQPEGREWREWRTSTLRIVAAVLILGMIAAVLIFYLFKGTIRIEAGRSGRMIPRFNGLERFAHWSTATSFLVLAISGLVVTFGRPLLIPLMGHDAFTATAIVTTWLHNFFSVPFVVGLLLMIVLWIRDNIPEKSDIAWIKAGGGFLGKGPGGHPEAGRFNAGQKGVFWMVVLGGLAMAITGYLMMLPFYVTDISGQQIVHVIHGLGAAVMIAGIVAHIYIGTLGMEGAFDAMGRGEVDENWAVEHHSGWYQTMRKRLGLRTPPRRHEIGEIDHHPAGAD